MNRAIRTAVYLLIGVLFPFSSSADVLVATNSLWKYRKGTSEASSPVDAWRLRAFNDDSWAGGPSPFHYGEGLEGGTTLADMGGNYSSVFLRRQFDLTGIQNWGRLTLRAACDDGFIAWINGVEVARYNVPDGALAYNGFASGAVAEPVAYTEFRLPPLAGYLVEGMNTIAVQVFNTSLTSSDLQFNMELEVTAPDLTPPAISSVAPPPGVINELNQVTVTFSEPVTSVDANDLWLNGTPATAVAGSGDTYVFSFDTPAVGNISMTWFIGHGIVDLAETPNRFNESAAGSTWQYRLADKTPPLITAINPPAKAILRELSQVEVSFSKPVAGLDAGDLLINGKPALSVTPLSETTFLFQLGVVDGPSAQLTWVTGHGIKDEAEPPNHFAGGGWSYTINPAAPLEDVVINEFLASNISASGLKDEDGDLEDWIELYNRSTAAVNLEGWSLTDDADKPGLWTFPAITLQPGQYYYLFASGKDRKPLNGARLHTNFKIGPYGEYLGLYSAESPRRVVSELAPKYPPQRNDYSYGQDFFGGWSYFPRPTPGSPNGSSTVTGVAAEPHFSVKRGAFNQPFNLSLSCPTAGARIIYTLDGSEPTTTNGIPYVAPFQIRTTSVVRAAAFLSNGLPSRVITHSYFMNLPAARLSLPIISLVTASNNLRGKTGIMEINPRNTTKRGIAWERPTSAEYILPQGGDGFQIDCGLRVQGGDYIRGLYNPNTTTPPQGKFSFRLYFRGDYGEGKLRYPLFKNSPVKEFDRLVLRAGMNDPTNPFITDELIRDLMIDMGQVTTRGNFANLFINGVYKGYYNPTEGYEEDFLQSWYGGNSSWDLITQGQVANSGDIRQWQAMYNSIIRSNMAIAANYQQSARLLDMTNFVDYLLVNIYGGTGDWPQNNWRAVHERVPGALVRYCIWDAEWALGYSGRSVTLNTLTGELAGSSEIAAMYQRMKASPEFRLLFADRIQKHFFNDGALTDANITNHFVAMREELRGVIPTMQTTILTTWVPRRRTNIFNQMTLAGLMASTNAPVFSQHGGRVPRGYELKLSAPAGAIYYTVNGIDPRVPISGEVSPAAIRYDGHAISLQQDVQIQARTLLGTNWSALNEARFMVAGLGTPLRFTEIMYDPSGGEAYEFIEIQNFGGTTVDLSLMTVEGVSYIFPDQSRLAPGETLVLSSANNPAAFARRYPGLKVYGTFSGTLANGGERLTLKDRSGLVITSIDYRRGNGWPKSADGLGASLEFSDLEADPNDPAAWRASATPGGTPGIAPLPEELPTIYISEIMAENLKTITNGDMQPDWLELHNSSAAPITLDGWSLSDNGEQGKYMFPGWVTLGAGERLVVWCDSQFDAPGLHTGFALNREGEGVYLFDPATNRVDAVSFGNQVADYSLGRVDGKWQLCLPTPNQPNIPAELASPDDLVINEWLANSAPGGEDWLELFNRNPDKPASLEGVYLATSNALFQVHSHSFIGAGGFVKLLADEKSGPNHLNFKLSAAGGTIVLYDATGGEINRVKYAAQVQDVSEGRLPDGSTNIVKFVAGSSGGAGNYIPLYFGPVLNELLASHSSPSDVDWVELYNPNPLAWDLGGMSLSSSEARPGKWIFPAGTSVPASGYLVVTMSGSLPASTGADSALNSGQSLPAEGGGVYLFNTANQLVDSVEYGLQLPDQTIGRTGGGWGLLAAPTPGITNASAASLGVVDNVRINEWVANPVTGDDWFELYNGGPLPVSLAGCFLTDDPSIIGTTNFMIRSLNFLPGGGFGKWIADGEISKGWQHVNFSLDAMGESLRLYAANRSLIDAVDFGPQLPDESAGRYPDGGADIVSFSNNATPGAPNAFSPQSRLKVEIPDLQGSSLVLRFIAQPGISYSIDVTDSLGTGNWQRVVEVPSGPDPREIVEPLDLPAGARVRYFRLSGATAR